MSARYHPGLRRVDGRWPLPPPLAWAEVEDFLATSGAARRTGVSMQDASAA